MLRSVVPVKVTTVVVPMTSCNRLAVHRPCVQSKGECIRVLSLSATVTLEC